MDTTKSCSTCVFGEYHPPESGCIGEPPSEGWVYCTVYRKPILDIDESEPYQMDVICRFYVPGPEPEWEEEIPR